MRKVLLLATVVMLSASCKKTGCYICTHTTTVNGDVKNQSENTVCNATEEDIQNYQTEHFSSYTYDDINGKSTMVGRSTCHKSK